MPAFIQWKWKEETRSFLVIFHFFDDYSEKNLRLKQRSLRKDGKSPPIYVISPYEKTTHPIMTWAPSHIESALVSQVLCYANIVNGFNERIKRTLRPILEVTTVKREKKIIELAVSDDLKKALQDKGFILELKSTKERDDFEEAIFCCPLSIEYVELIWDILKTTLTYVKEIRKKQH